MFRHLSSSLCVATSISRNRARISTITNGVHVTPPNSGSSEGKLVMAYNGAVKDSEVMGSEIGGNVAHMTHTDVSTDPFFSSPVKFDSKSAPLSFPLMQLRRNHANLPLPQSISSNECSLGSSILSLASLISETQRVFLTNQSSSSVDSGHSIVWLFGNIFVSSPALIVDILTMMGDYLYETVMNEITWVMADFEWEIIKQGDKEKSRSLAEILADNPQAFSMLESKITEMSSRKRDAYEKLVNSADASSLILSNYAQFLYQIENDNDMAEEYWKRAVRAKPADEEAKSRYGMFLWKERNDIDKAEEMFLEAIEASPNNNHHLANYAHFLWSTGGADTCVPRYDDMATHVDSL